MYCFKFYKITLKVLLLLTYNVFIILAEFPSDIRKCIAGDVECIRSVANEVIKNNPQGHKGLSIPPLEPFHINLIQTAQQHRSISMNITMRNLNYHGFSSQRFTKIVGFEKDPEKSKFEFYIQAPKLRIIGQYKVSGRLLVLPIEGDGDIEMIMSNVRMSVKLKPKVLVKNEKHYLEVDKLKILTEVDRLETKLTNLFNGDKVLGDTINRVMNENWKAMWDEVEPGLNSSVTEVIKNLLNRIFRKVSYDDIFADS